MKDKLHLSVVIAMCFFLSAPAFSEHKYTREKVIANRPNIIWTNQAVQKIPKLLTEKFLEINAGLNVHNVVVNTPLKPLDHISKITGKNVYLKDESLQNSGSFKIRGVANEVYFAIISYIERVESLLDSGGKVLEKPFYVVTQSDGNHGIAMLTATALIVHNQLVLRPELARYIKNIEPLVFTIKALPEVKKAKMYEALKHYRDVVGDYKKGDIIVKENYLEAKKAREVFLSGNLDNATYMEHGGYDIMNGHASIGIEIDKQLRKLGIGNNKKVVFIVPVGAGGPVGMIAGLKTARPKAVGVVVQTNPYSALVKSLIAKKLVSNKPNPDPTIILKGKKVVFEDGIAVDAPEQAAVDFARKIVDCGLVVDDKASLYFAAPLLYRDLSKYSDPVVGGTTSATLEALLEYPDVAAIKNADVVVLLGAEKNVDSEIISYIKTTTEGSNPYNRQPLK